jgi:hypothetical protein
MKTLLTCDEIFESLTAAPVVEGSDNAKAIQDHIADCDSCAQLAEALKPATHLIHEAMPVELRAELPVYLADEDASSRIMSQIDELPTTTRGSNRNQQNEFRRTVLGFGAAAAVLLLLLWRQLPAENASVAQAGLLQLNRMNLPFACRDSKSIEAVSTEVAANRPNAPNVSPPETPTESSYICCTTCHASAKTTGPRINDLTQLVASCSVCH